MATSAVVDLTADTITSVHAAGASAETRELYVYCNHGPVWFGGSTVSRTNGFLVETGGRIGFGKLSATEEVFAISPNKACSIVKLLVANEGGGGAL